MSNQLIFLRRMLYDLKKNYGKRVDLYYQISVVPDLTTGVKAISRTVYQIRKAIILPVSFATSILFTRAYLQNVGKDFAYGAYNDQELKTVVIDGVDLPKTLVIIPRDYYIVLEHQKFEISKVSRLEENYGYLLQIKRVTGVEPDEIHIHNQVQTIRFTQSAIGVLT